mgnify:CR=1 FL=1
MKARGCTCSADMSPRDMQNPTWHDEDCALRTAHEAAEEKAERAAGWHKMKPTGAGGDYRDFVDGEPVHCGNALELRMLEYVYDREKEEDVVRNLELILSSDALQAKLDSLDYVDLRFGNRVYYQLK